MTRLSVARSRECFHEQGTTYGRPHLTQPVSTLPEGEAPPRGAPLSPSSKARGRLGQEDVLVGLLEETHVIAEGRRRLSELKLCISCLIRSTTIVDVVSSIAVAAIDYTFRITRGCAGVIFTRA
jgi:hypothetical protein